MKFNLKKQFAFLEERFINRNPQKWYSKLGWLLFRLYRFLKITLREFKDDRLLLRAMALTYATMLSLVPLSALLFSLFKLFDGAEWFSDVVRPVLMENLAPGSGEAIVGKVERVLFKNIGTTVGGIGLAFFLFVVHSIFSTIESTFNLIWGVPNSKAGAIQRLPTYWGLLTIIPITVVISLAITTYIQALPLVNRAVESVSFIQTLISSSIPIIIVMFGFFLLYKFLPGTKVRFRAALTGAVTAGLLYEIVKSIFIFYTGRLVQYDAFYGSLAIIPLLMIWINLSWLVVLIGVEISFVYQHYNVLLIKRKHIQFSRAQKDAIAFQILIQATLAFRGKLKPLEIEKWSNQNSIPPKVVRDVTDRLEKGGLLVKVQNGEKSGVKILLNRDPNYIRIYDINKVLSGDIMTEWTWPDGKSWDWLKKWLSSKHSTAGSESQDMTLDGLVETIAENEKRKSEDKIGTNHLTKL